MEGVPNVIIQQIDHDISIFLHGPTSVNYSDNIIFVVGILRGIRCFMFRKEIAVVLIHVLFFVENLKVNKVVSEYQIESTSSSFVYKRNFK